MGRVGRVLQDIVGVNRVKGGIGERETVEIAARHSYSMNPAGLLQERHAVVHSDAESVSFLEGLGPVSGAASQIQHPGAIQRHFRLQVRGLRFISRLTQDCLRLALDLQLQDFLLGDEAPPGFVEMFLHRLRKGDEPYFLADREPFEELLDLDVT